MIYSLRSERPYEALFVSGIRSLSFLRYGKWRRSMARQRQEVWEEHESHYAWIQQEEALIQAERSRLDVERAALEKQRARLVAECENAHNSLREQCRRRAAALESALNQHHSRVNRWRRECDRYNAIDRFIPRP